MPTALFVHNGATGRFDFIARALVQRGWQCGLINRPAGRDLPGVRTVHWRHTRGSSESIFPPAMRAEADFLRGFAAAQCALKLKAEGFDPAVIIGHPGWGEMVFLSEVFPHARQIQIGEFYYRSRGSDGFDTEFGRLNFDKRVKGTSKNAALAMSYAEAARIVAPTRFQASQLPEIFGPRVSVIHEGVDLDKTRPIPNAEVRIEGRVALDRRTPVVTFVNRVFEPLRGFHVFMRALPRLLSAEPDVHVLMIGSDGPKGYGLAPPDGSTWKQVLLEELGGRLDMDRVHFVGHVPYDHLLVALSISAAHVYLTYPFVLSWSLLDAMACECLVVGSDTAPVRDVIVPDQNGLLVDFFDHDALADTLIDICRNPQAHAHLRRAARATIAADFDRKAKCEPAWLALIDEVLRPG